MNNAPNLDYSLLKKILRKTAIETAIDPEDERPRQPSPRTRAPRRETTKMKPATILVKEEIEDLKNQLQVAQDTNNSGKAKVLREKIEEMEGVISWAMEHPDTQNAIENAQKSINPMDPSSIQRAEEQVRSIVDDLVEKKMFYVKKEKGTPLEDRLRHSILEEEYEKAPKIQEELERFKKLVQQHRIIDRMVVASDNLDLVQPDKPYDIDQARKRHQFRYRNEPGGADELMWEGMDGTKNKDKGIGSDQYSDVGSPASINVASNRWRKPFFSRQEDGMPNERMERDPLEEKQTTDTNFYEFDSMQQR